MGDSTTTSSSSSASSGDGDAKTCGQPFQDEKGEEMQKQQRRREPHQVWVWGAIVLLS
jgi:hypothetical protein